jgi:hypothetical protein
MKTIEERLAETAEEIERQTASWRQAARALAALGDVTVRVPVEVLAELDATVMQAEAVGARRAVIAGAVQV